MNVIAAASFAAEDLAGYPVPPAWRKATRNMIMATASIERALALVPEVKIDGRVALILGSSSGELEASADFLSTWAKLRMARPVLFQNSLHNASTGFASIQFKISGPSFTVSAKQRTPLECIELARILLAEKQAEVALVTLVEGHKVLSDQIGITSAREGACTLVMRAGGPGRAPPMELEFVPLAGSQPLFDIQASEIYRWAAAWEQPS